MEIYGNLDSLKNVIASKYSKRMKEAEDSVQKEINALNEVLGREVELMKARIMTRADSDARKEYSKIISEEKLKAKREFEEKREGYINEVFDEALKKAPKIAHSQEYIDYLKSKMPKNLGGEIIADSAYYKKYFPDLKNWKVDKEIIGLKFRVANIIYDFTIDNALKSKRDTLRPVVSKALFGA